MDVIKNKNKIKKSNSCKEGLIRSGKINTINRSCSGAYNRSRDGVPCEEQSSLVIERRRFLVHDPRVVSGKLRKRDLIRTIDSAVRDVYGAELLHGIQRFSKHPTKSNLMAKCDSDKRADPFDDEIQKISMENVKEKGKGRDLVLAEEFNTACNIGQTVADGRPVNATIKAADMPSMMQAHALRCATMASQNDNCSFKQVAFALKKEFDKAYGPAWHCIVGSSFGSFVTHSVGGFLYFSIDKKVWILLFKTTVEPLGI